VPITSAWLIPLVLFVLVGLAASLYLVKVRLPFEARNAGVRSLAALPWSDFIQLVLAVLNGRGYERAFGGGGTDGEYVLERAGQKWLLSSRYSRTWKPGTIGIAEFAAHLRHQGMQGGVLAIPGRFAPSTFSVGRAHRIELLDGSTMWEELLPALSDEHNAQIEQAARRRLRAQFGLAWVVAAAIGLVAWWAMDDLGLMTPAATPAAVVTPQPAAAPTQVPAADTPTATPPPAASAKVPAAAPAEAPVTPPPPAKRQATELELNQRRQDIAHAVQALPHVRTAHWPSPSTLEVRVASVQFDPQSICPLLEHDPDLGASRLQVQYPVGSDRLVRFLQCRAY
jgi:hypothetical protein